MLNVRALANGVNSRVNDNQTITWIRSSGYTTSADGKRTPTTNTVTGRDRSKALCAGFGFALGHLLSFELSCLTRLVRA